VDGQIGRDARHAGAPHHPVAAGRRDRHALDPIAGRGQAGTADRQVIGREVDRGRPDLADAEAGRRRDEAGQTRTHRLVHRPVDGAGLARSIVGIAPAEEQPALLEPPIQTRADVEHHRLALDGERLGRLKHGHRVPNRAGGDPDPGGVANGPQAGAATPACCMASE